MEGNEGGGAPIDKLREAAIAMNDALREAAKEGRMVLLHAHQIQEHGYSVPVTELHLKVFKPEF